jgi:molybdopterin converting factor small subunit
MTIEVKLFATLRRYLPSDGDGKSTRIELPDGAAIADVLAALKIPDGEAQLLLLDGKHKTDRSQPLEGDCTISIFPAMAGG